MLSIMDKDIDEDYLKSQVLSDTAGGFASFEGS